MPLASTRSLTRWLAIAAAVILLDQGAKALIVHSLPLYDSVWLLPWLNLTSLRNTGAAFSMFAGAPGTVFIALAAAVSLGILVWLYRHPQASKLEALAFSLIMGGAIGNAIDRGVHGYVVDFIDFHVGAWHFAAFNIADSAITIGAGLLLLDALLQYRRSKVDAP
ncbi:MAG: signal peptidase II [Nevskiaceae bacterium]|nr:MAG: signal peptidase II [Nevskiaceae bacterium]TBR74578.1 MAG: signal peptidase II [Nevskiaceae bacterium]